MFLLIKLLLFNIKNSLLLEKPNLRFWYILSFAIGILFCFFTPETYRIINILIIILLSLILVFFYLYSDQYKILTKILLHFSIMFLIGYSVAFHKCINIVQNDFKSAEYDITIEGQIQSIKLTSHETILILQTTKSPNTALYNGKIRIKIDDNLIPQNSLQNGDIVKVKTSLIPIKYGFFPNDKSYENYAKFFEIIASGRAKYIEVLKKSSNYNTKLGFFDTQQKRNDIQQQIYKVNNKSAGAGIVIAILTGNNSFIPKNKLDNIRHSGCAHILAISGLHMAIVISCVFFLFIHFFALFPKLALRHNTKKLAIFPAILTCLFYIQIANVPISALRSFLMVIIASIALLADRKKNSLNTLFITFFTMLCFEPNYILSPSFQMSFMAVFGLTTFYNNNCITETSIFSKKKGFFAYLIGIVMSSVVATISTVFFEIYHFKQYAWIGLISNIFVIPITEFFVLPLGFIGMIFNNTIIGDFFYILSGFFANIVLLITDFTAHLPNSFLLAKQMTNSQLFTIVFGIIFLFLSYAKILKFFGIILIITGFMAYILAPKYVLIYNDNLKNIVFFENEKYYSYQPIKSEFIQSVWSQNLGVSHIPTMTNKNKNLSCVGDRKSFNFTCEYRFNNKTINIFQGRTNKVIGITENKIVDF